MNIRDLKYVIAVAEFKHFGKAADHCFVSQPTLSGQIKKLEEELGVTLFERTNRSVEITPVGEEILIHARQIIEQSEVLIQTAKANHDPIAGPLRIGAILTLSPYLIPLILQPLNKQFPQMHLILTEEMTETLIQRLQHHEIDAALLATPVDENEFCSIPLFREPFYLAHPRKHPFNEVKHISQADLDGSELLLLSEGHCLAQQAMDVCRLKERNTQGEMADLRAASLETLLQLVGAGLGSTLLPALALRSSLLTRKGIVFRELKLRHSYRQISLVYRKSFPREQALNTFINIIRNNLPDTVQPTE